MITPYQGPSPGDFPKHERIWSRPVVAFSIYFTRTWNSGIKKPTRVGAQPSMPTGLLGRWLLDAGGVVEHGPQPVWRVLLAIPEI
jgi:hypothetical protein